MTKKEIVLKRLNSEQHKKELKKYICLSVTGRENTEIDCKLTRVKEALKRSYGSWGISFITSAIAIAGAEKGEFRSISYVLTGNKGERVEAILDTTLTLCDQDESPVDRESTK